MNWNKLESISDLLNLINLSKTYPDKYYLIFKHSTRCPVSAMSLNRLEKNWLLINNQIQPYFLDLIQYRSVSNQIENLLGVRHESPQILLIKNGKCIYNESHHLISVEELAKHVN